MKTIFGFLTGAVVGAGGLFGLRKVLKMVDNTEVTASPGAASPGGAGSSGLHKSPLKTQEAPDTLMTPGATTRVSVDLEKAQEAENNPEELVSMVGEPVDRHQEPVAAVESDPEAVTPRSESAENAIPDNIVVKPANTSSPTRPKDSDKAASSEINAVKNPATTSRSPQGDDFRVIMDIGPVFNQKLRDAGIKSFSDLVKLTPAQIEEKTGIPAERIERGRWLEQVREIMASEARE